LLEPALWKGLKPVSGGGHPPRGSVDYFWAHGWVIPADYPTGPGLDRLADPERRCHSDSGVEGFCPAGLNLWMGEQPLVDARTVAQ